MTRAETSRRCGNIRTRQRYHALKALGYGRDDCRYGSYQVQRFREFVAAKGVDPDTYGDLAQRRPGGWPRLETTCRGHAAAEARKRRYHELKALGANAQDASAGSTCELAFLRIKRELFGPFRARA